MEASDLAPYHQADPCVLIKSKDDILTHRALILGSLEYISKS
jgi:hypothetical protein